MNDKEYILRAVELARNAVAAGGEPFGAILVRDGQVIAEGMNEAHINHDPSAHAEMQTLRTASRALKTHTHPNSTMYASGKPCAMCMAAMIQSGVTRIVFCADDDVGGQYGYSTEALYAQMKQGFGDQGVVVEHLPVEQQHDPFEMWQQKKTP